MKLPRRLSAHLLTCWLLLGLGGGMALGAIADEVSEYGMKAVLFYRLAQFIYWPANEPAGRPTVFCVVGKNPLGPAISQLRQAGNHLDLRISPTDLTPCQLLFIGRSESQQLDNWLSRSDSKRLVTVSDIPGFAQAGGMIELPLEGDRVGIIINRSSATKKGLDFNAQLLRLARVINP